MYKGTVNENDPSKVENVTALEDNINSKYHEASAIISPDGKTMYFTRNNFTKKLKRDKKGVSHLKLFQSVKENDKWGKATELSLNSDSYSTGHPALSKDGKRLYFVSDMPGGFGETDIYYVDILANNSFSAPVNLGKTSILLPKKCFRI